ncbi:MAG: hypothetical protein EBX40_03665 [Gammaproteobacteria bacterium]|nr:hypothetical protein [Gammaproteobacteria bacterium]
MNCLFAARLWALRAVQGGSGIEGKGVLAARSAHNRGGKRQHIKTVTSHPLLQRKPIPQIHFSDFFVL